MALCSRIVRKKKGGKSGSPNKNQGKEVGNGKISLLTLASFCWAKKFVSLVNLANCCESNENENTPDMYRLTPTLSCEGWEKSGGSLPFCVTFCMQIVYSSRIKLSEVHLDMVNCGVDGDQYCPVRLLCPQKTRQQLCSQAKLLVSLLEGVLSGHPNRGKLRCLTKKPTISDKNEPAEIFSTNNSQQPFQPPCFNHLRLLPYHVPLKCFFFTTHLKGEILGYSNYFRLPVPSSCATFLGDLLATSKDCFHQDILGSRRR